MAKHDLSYYDQLCYENSIHSFVARRAKTSQLWGVHPRIISNFAFVSPNFDPGISLKE